jgi:histidinol-phosphate/aromatic aminotransferase/cobyric acid decarboxylase-like protein
MNDPQRATLPDVAALVERLNDKWKHSEEDCYAAAAALTAQAIEIERLTRETFENRKSLIARLLRHAFGSSG